MDKQMALQRVAELRANKDKLHAVHPGGFRPALEELFLGLKEALADKSLTFSEVVANINEVVTVVETLCVEVVGSDAEFDALVADCEWAVTKYVVPYDLPFVNEFVERFVVDPQLVNAVRPLLTFVRARVKAKLGDIQQPKPVGPNLGGV